MARDHMMPILISRRLCVAVVAVCVSTAVSHVPAADRDSAALSSIRRDDLQRDLTFLASDALEGREAGTRGGHAAAAYIADRLKSLGVKPAGEDGSFLQTFGRDYRNVLGVIPGADPDLAKEYIVVGGHLDHVGYGSSSNSNGPVGRIHNGADDNASGVSAILEVAEALTKLAVPLPRSVVIAFWDGEEKGLLGSKHWVNNPTVPLDKVRLAINCDMLGRLTNDSITVYGSRTRSGLRQCVVRGNEEPAIRLIFDAWNRSDSDHFSFFEKSIPYLMLFTGEHPDYHRPSDDVERVNFEGLERITRLLFQVVVQQAETTDLGGFRPECRNESSRQGIQLKACPPRFGITWAIERKPGEPFTVTRVEPGTPAETAGLMVGDVITQVDGQPAGEIAELRSYVAAAAKSLKLEYQRPGSEKSQSTVVSLAGPCRPNGCDVRHDPADIGTLYVLSADPESPAGKSGLRNGDRILIDLEQDGAAEEASTGWTIEREGRLLRLKAE